MQFSSPVDPRDHQETTVGRLASHSMRFQEWIGHAKSAFVRLFVEGHSLVQDDLLE